MAVLDPALRSTAGNYQLDSVSLRHTLRNPSGKIAIVLIHGACVSSINWDLVVPHLPETYQLLLPDLPGHGQSQDITPFSPELSSKLIAQLIRTHAINGKAHVIGHSLGAHVAINLASTYPEVVDAVFVSGFEIYPPTPFTRLLPYAMWTEN
jgi:pimeloyl-ACP methyl ester carboxylesterase